MSNSDKNTKKQIPATATAGNPTNKYPPSIRNPNSSKSRIRPPIYRNNPTNRIRSPVIDAAAMIINPPV